MFKNSVWAFAVAASIAAALSQSCNVAVSGGDTLTRAEDDFRNGRYELAQQMCDSLVAGTDFNTLSVSELCRLSLLFMRLSDTSDDIDTNTALAARTLKVAIERNADSTLMFLNTVPVEDQARVALLTAIHEAQSAPAITDTIGYEY